MTELLVSIAAEILIGALIALVTNAILRFLRSSESAGRSSDNAVPSPSHG